MRGMEGGGGAYGAGVVCVPWSTALASSSMWTAVEKRFQKNWSLARVIVYVKGCQIGWTGRELFVLSCPTSQGMLDWL